MSFPDRTADVGDLVRVEECYLKHTAPWLPIYHVGRVGTVTDTPGPNRFIVASEGFVCRATKITRLSRSCTPP